MQKKTQLSKQQIKLKEYLIPVVKTILNENANLSKPINSFLSASRLTDKIKSLTNTDKYEEIYHTDVSSKNFGIFALIISNLSVTVKAGKGKNGVIYLIIEFKYTHTDGGGNGYDLRIKSNDNGKTWTT